MLRMADWPGAGRSSGRQELFKRSPSVYLTTPTLLLPPACLPWHLSESSISIFHPSMYRLARLTGATISGRTTAAALRQSRHRAVVPSAVPAAAQQSRLLFPSRRHHVDDRPLQDAEVALSVRPVAVAAASSTMGTNADLSKVATANTLDMEWVPSPVSNVWRKRVYHTGGTESGRVTSVVKYGENSAFHDHPHPEGEEIFVLEGTFSDKRGDHQPGTLLLNPEGFEHAPSSREGCIILVRLRQYPGERPQMALDSNAMEWEEAEMTGASKPIKRKQLFKSDRFDDSIELQLWEAGSEGIALQAPHGVEMFVVSGECQSGGKHGLRLSRHSWLRVPPDESVELKCSSDCTVYLKLNGLPLAEPLKA